MAYESHTSQVMAALADPTRRAIVEQIGRTPAPVGRIAREFPISRPAISQHLKVLSDAGIVTATADGTRRIYRLEPSAIAALRDWCDQMWDAALSNFEAEARRIAERDQS